MTEHHYSASQVGTYETCSRKWAWKYIDDRDMPGNKYAEFGKKTHTYLEGWLKNRIPPDGGAEAKLAERMLLHLPPPQSIKPENVEKKIEFFFGSMKFKMAIDLYVPMLLLADGREMPAVYDHKTTSSLEWVKQPEALVDDVQFTLYAGWVLTELRAPEVYLQWTYGIRGSGQVVPVRHIVNGKAIRDRLSKTIESAREMQALHESGVSAIDVPYNADGCEQYGGCPFKSLCNLSVEERMKSIMSQGTKMTDFLAKLEARKNGASGVNPPATPAPIAAVAPPATSPVTTGGGSLAERIAARKAEQAVTAPVAAPVPAPVAAAETVAAAPAAEPVATRGPGRPRKEPTQQNIAADRWVEFAKESLPIAVAVVGTEGLLDAELRTGAIELAAGLADDLLKQYQSRFGS